MVSFVVEACSTRCERVGADFGAFGDDLEGGELAVGVVDAEESGGEVVRCFDDAVGVAGPESGGLVGRAGKGLIEEVLVSCAEADACREGTEGSGEGASCGQLFQLVIVWSQCG